MTLASLVARWNMLPVAMRALCSGLMFFVFAVPIVIALLLQRPQGTLFAGSLHPEQLAEVEERLAAWGVPFTPAADNLIVENSQRGALLLRLSLAGIPHDHVAGSAERLATIGALTPQEVIDEQTRAGLAGDIELGLRGIAGIDDAQVIVAPAKPAQYADESAHDASASVRLRVRDGAQLSASALEGVRNFVAASVPGLDPVRVTIVDDRGLALSAQMNSGEDQDALQGSLQSAFDQAFGAGSTIVRVRADRDARAVQTHHVRQSPLGALTSSGTDETYITQGKHYHHREHNEEFGSETEDTTATTPGGALARLSVAVFVDETRGFDLVKIRELAAATVGFDEKRGDEITVQAVNFTKDIVPRKDGWWLAYGAIVPLLPTLCIAIAMLIGLRWSIPALTTAIQALLQRVSIARTKQHVSGIAPSRVLTALRDEPPYAAAAIISALPAATAAAVLDMYPQSERSAIIRRMQRPHSDLIPNPEELLDHA